MANQDQELTTLQLYMQQMGKYPMLTPEEERELAIRAKKGDKEALKKLVEGNLRFVVNIAKNFMGWGVPLTDLIAAGNLGLIEAAKRFDPDKNVKFISYAVWWIRQAIMQTIFQQTGAVRIPIKESLFISKVKNAYEKLKESLGREPTEEEIAKELKTSVKKVKNALAIVRQPISLDMPLGEGGEEDFTLLDILSKKGTEDVEKDLVESTLKEEFERLLNVLDEREREIIKLRYGLEGLEPKTLEEVGEMLGISRERVRQLEQRALKKLKAVALKKHLQNFLS
ncbi:RNA polymerase sigma factor RpoD (Sigma-A) (Sigma-43) [Sulfurihydrogenibium azorense Az-Fu1]|uniref:RNA polymerase sigma factor RpoD (Sigma-A) (Sigma-43) n=1 Tax=Sulfurihydrogenibium azorense (strain DSM 15241 / OCM 825 / Az-Fu1) TaxID=204536 RepID=C1DV14_SULAA|nr:RNA polymerase sigma factor RpoD/SigA [Sulfurihydrogenibium azorense]ACN98896.1 RNA polymerase sigma factor RpoD (Sigma-A) (Sigma-43) [Sulfurihydrogenibium azorense Az-Fu1]